MSEKQNRGIQDLTKYDEMTTEELEEILRLDAENTDDQESDAETLFYIMGVLAERNKKNGHTGNTAQEAYEIFKQHYMPETNNEIPVSVKSNKTKNPKPLWIRRLVAAAAVFAVIIGSSVTAKAFGVDVWKAVIQWTQDTFNFGSWGKPNNVEYSSLRDALEEGNTPVWLAPTYIPDGYTAIEINAELSPLQKQYRAIYSNDGQELVITIRDYMDKYPVYVEQSEGLVEEYEVAGITYYLFENNKQIHAVWIVDSYECYIAGQMTIDELKMMIDSIAKGQ